MNYATPEEKGIKSSLIYDYIKKIVCSSVSQVIILNSTPRFSSISFLLGDFEAKIKFIVCSFLCEVSLLEGRCTPLLAVLPRFFKSGRGDGASSPVFAVSFVSFSLRLFSQRKAAKEI